MMDNPDFIYKGVPYWEENGQYFKYRHNKKLSVSKRDYEKIKSKINDSHKGD